MNKNQFAWFIVNCIIWLWIGFTLGYQHQTLTVKFETPELALYCFNDNTKTWDRCRQDKEGLLYSLSGKARFMREFNPASPTN